MPNVGDIKIKEGRLKRVTSVDGDTWKTEDLGEAVAVSVDGKDRVVQFELNGKPFQVGAWGPDGSIRDYTAYTKGKTPEPEDDTNALLETGKGFAKSAGQSVATIAKGINAIPGIGEKLSPQAGINQLERMTELENTPQKIGAGIEQIGEMYLTGGPLKQGAAALATKAAPLLAKAPALLKAAPTVVAATSEAANAAGNAALHGQDPADAAMFAGGSAVAVKGLEKAAPPLLKAAKAQYGRVLAATTNKNKEAAERVIPELIKRGEVGSAEGLLGKARTNVGALGSQIDDAVKAVPQADRVNATAVLDALETYKADFVVDGVKVDPQAVAHINELQKVVSDVIGDGTERAFGGVPYQSLNKIRQIWDSKVSKAGGYGVKDLAEGSKVDAMKEGANAIRSELSKAQPDIAKINQEFRLWRSVADLLEATETRQVGQVGGLRKALAPSAAAALGLSTAAGGGDVVTSGAVGFGSLAVLSAVDALAKSGRWNTLNAVAKDKIANAIMAGDAQVLGDLIGRGGAASGGMDLEMPSLEK
jgi:hypothetical protein